MIKTKNRMLRRMLKIILTALSLLLVVCFLTQGPIYTIERVSAAEKIVYLKEIKVFEAKHVQPVKKKALRLLQRI